MPQSSLALNREQAIQEKMEELFSSGKFSDKVDQARALAEMPGLDLFATAVPWRITMPEGRAAIEGFSETLYFAAKDILASLVVIAPRFSADTIVALGIDEARLPPPRRSKRLQPPGRD